MSEKMPKFEHTQEKILPSEQTLRRNADISTEIESIDAGLSETSVGERNEKEKEAFQKLYNLLTERFSLLAGKGEVEKIQKDLDEYLNDNPYTLRLLNLQIDTETAQRLSVLAIDKAKDFLKTTGTLGKQWEFLKQGFLGVFDPKQFNDKATGEARISSQEHLDVTKDTMLSVIYSEIERAKEK